MRVSRQVERRTLLKAAGASLASLGVAAAGCGGGSGSSSGGAVTIRYAWWGADDRAKRINETIDLFEKKHPKIKVKTDFQPYEDFWKKFNTQAAGGNPPDVIQNAVTFLRKYGGRNVLMDLKPQVQSGELSTEGFRSGLEKFAEIDGKLLGLPVASNSMAYIIDEKVYEKAGVTPEFGWTWDDWLAGMERIRSRTGVAGETGPHSIMYYYDLVLRQKGKAFFTEDGLGFSKSDLETEWAEAVKRIKSGLYTDPKKVEQIKPKSATAAGLSAGEFTWDNFTVRYDSEGKSSYGIAPIPTTDGSKTGQYLGSLMLSGTARTKHPKEVATFINFMVHDPEVGRIMGYDRGVLATTKQFEAFEPTDKVSKQISEYEKQIAEKGVLETITPHPAGADVIEAAFLRVATEVSLDKASPGEAVEKFFSEAETAFTANS
ncbi:extracellular solute-binding protein [Streptomyces sp. N2-109]|uniref:Extracellular solute-binding protein n=1 Tax=Streptomyces gossypii TaxID=2883101 RepID=A0ABT2JZ67_9ACTN|nr:extracellular solute-binding protein [Streptomyces gossypii]MCT2593204.1 extracellular solute-binding protein [Streptomyces gossypii]